MPVTPPMIPMVDLTVQHQRLRAELERAIAGVLDSGRYILGPNMEAFEREAAEFLGAREAVALASGTDALHLALLAAGVQPGDEVITTSFSFIATATAIRFTGARPVFVDIDPRTFNLDPVAVEQAITPATRAVLPVHLYGQPAAMEHLQAICRDRKLVLIEDCAQSFGASRGGRMTGTFGDAGCFSFFPSKNLGAIGDGGMVATDSPDLAHRLRRLRNHGSEQPGRHEQIGFNSRLDELQAAVLRVKLRHVTGFNEQRRRVAVQYNRLLAGLAVTTPYEDPEGVHVYHQYTVLSDAREQLQEALQQAGVASAIHYALPIPRQPVFAADYAELALPVADSVARRCLCLPIYPELDDAQIARVAEAVARQVEKK